MKSNMIEQDIWEVLGQLRTKDNSPLGEFPTRTIPHRLCNGPEWFY